jgi:putative spermidine/putrescine transport system ATP-binding protein
MAVAGGLVLLFLLMPVVALIPMSFSGTRWLVLPPTDLSLRWYAEFLTSRDWREATVTSLTVAAAAMGLATVLGTLAGMALARGRFPGRHVVRGVVLAPLIVPVMILALGFYYLFARLGLIGSLVALVLSHVVLATPYVVINVEAVMRSFDLRLEWAARMLGASAWQAFWRVTLPLTRTGVLVGALFAFITSFDEVVVAMFLSGTSAVTLPKLMWDSITLDELSPLVTAVASLQIGMALAVFAAAETLRGRGMRLAWASAAPEDGGGVGSRAPLGGGGTRPAMAAEEVRLSTEPLQIVGLSKRFGSVVAVDDVTLQVEPGELLTILGPSGSGKTTLLNLIAGFDNPTSGEVLLGGRALTREPPNRRGVGMVFQNYALFPHMTVFANVAFPLRLRRLAEPDIRGRVADILGVVQLAGLAERYPRQLSGGQQQRVALARALVFRPPLLLMDEPFGALDVHLRARMQGELRQLHRQLGITVLFVTHDQEEAMLLADRIAVIARGRLQQVGRAEELYEAPANEFVAGFLGESNLLRGTVASASGGTLHVVTAGGAAFSVAGRAVAGQAVTLLLRPEAIRLVADPPAGHGLLGMVDEALYLGGLRKYTIRLSSAETLAARVSTLPGVRPLAPGDRVGVEWDPQDLRLL